jgi:hypothetical protein
MPLPVLALAAAKLAAHLVAHEAAATLAAAAGSDKTAKPADEIDSIVFPKPSCVLTTVQERTVRAKALIRQGHAANSANDTQRAAALFWEACRLEPHRTSTLISYLNMRLKMGDAELAAAAYTRVLEIRELSDDLIEHVRAKYEPARALNDCTIGAEMIGVGVASATSIATEMMCVGVASRLAGCVWPTASWSKGTKSARLPLLASRVSHVAWWRAAWWRVCVRIGLLLPLLPLRWL